MLLFMLKQRSNRFESLTFKSVTEEPQRYLSIRNENWPAKCHVMKSTILNEIGENTNEKVVSFSPPFIFYEGIS